tara:strand:+ start:1518 stop:3470 length:1953 start_codon:yes stop_codon:yes gene_type:complete
MANWTIDYTGAVLTGTVGVAITAGEVVEAIIKPIDQNGEISGYYIEAKNFKIGGATQGSGSPTLLNTWTGGNVDTEVNKIVFRDIGTPGTIDNTVVILVTLNGFTPALESETINFDVDENPTYPTSIFIESNSAIIASWPFVNTSQHTVALNSDYSTNSVVTVGDATTPAKYNVTSSPQDEAFSVVFSATFTSGAAYHYSDDPTAALLNLGTYIDNYVVTIDKVVSGGLITAFTVNVSYSPPKSGSNYPDPENFSALGHRLNVDYNVVPNTVAVVNTITSVAVPTSIPYTGGEYLMRVYGTTGSTYVVYIKNRVSNLYYDWDGGFQSQSTGQGGTIGSKGSSMHSFTIPYSNIDVSWDVLVVGLASATVENRVPTASGDLIINQFGLKTVSIKPYSHTLSNFSTLPSPITVTRPTRYQGDNYITVGVASTFAQASTRGASAIIKIQKLNPAIKTGMLAIHASIPYATTVLSVKDHIITLSQSVTLSAARIKFVANVTDVVPFTFSVSPNSNVLNVNTSNDHVRSIYGFEDVTGVVDGTQSGSTKTLVLDSTDNILVGMLVTGAGIGVGSLVNTITNATTLQLDTSHSGVSNNAEIEFSGANNPEMSAISVLVTKVGSNIVISGYIKATQITNTADVKINIDDMITISAQP